MSRKTTFETTSPPWTRQRFLEVIVSQMSVSEICIGAARDRRIGRSWPDIGSWYYPGPSELLAGTEESDILVRIANRHVIENAEVGAVTFRLIH